MDHPNLSPQINRALAGSELLGGLSLESVGVGSYVKVQTRNSVYILARSDEEDDNWLLRGGKHFPQSTVVRVSGSTFGGSMLKPGFLGLGMHMEAIVRLENDKPKTFTTSAIRRIELGYGEDLEDTNGRPSGD